MIKKPAIILVGLLTLGGLSWAAQSWTGTVSDTQCAATKHDAACIEKCVDAGSKYVLVSKGKVYQLDAQDKFKGMGGKRVKVTGSLSGTDQIAVSEVSTR
jgi:hypothetical protein